MYYVASGFFTEKQSKDVEKIEKMLDSMGANYFSPRNESINFSSETDTEMKYLATKMIFDNNIEKLDQSSRFIFNLRDNDSGTLFELGYVFGSLLGSVSEFKEVSTILNDKIDSLKVLESLRSGVKSDIDLDPMEYRNFDVLTIDERPPYTYIVAGYNYANRRTTLTYSDKGYDTNVMLVHSTAHYQSKSSLMDALNNKDLLDSLNESWNGVYGKQSQDFTKQID